MFDCIIVGSGPAGATAGYHLAKGGYSVLIIEKDALPRYKSCGGGVSPAVANYFDFDLAPVIDNTVTGVKFTWKMGDSVTTLLNTSEPMWMVKRDVFDNFLVEKAKEQGAQLQAGCTVTGINWQGDLWEVVTTSEKFQAKYLIAADGGKGPMAGWLGFKPQKQYVSVSLEVETAVPEDKLHTAHFDFGSVKSGSVWNFPKSNGYSISAAVMGNTKGKAKDLQKALTNYAQKAGIDLSNSQFSEHVLCLWTEKQPLHGNNALVVGEAGAMVDPLLGEGIRPAIATGMRAAEAIDKALAGKPEAIANYSQIVNDEWSSEFVLAQRLAGLFYGMLANPIYKIGVKQPEASQLMSKILCGEIKYSDVIEKAMKKLKPF